MIAREIAGFRFASGAAPGRFVIALGKRPVVLGGLFVLERILFYGVH